MNDLNIISQPFYLPYYIILEWTMNAMLKYDKDGYLGTLNYEMHA